MACVAALLCGTAAQLQGAALVRLRREREAEWCVRKGNATSGERTMLFCGIRKIAIEALRLAEALTPKLEKLLEQAAVEGVARGASVVRQRKTWPASTSTRAPRPSTQPVFP